MTTRDCGVSGSFPNLLHLLRISPSYIMNKFSLKEGWHPKGKDGKKESWRGDFKGINQVVSSYV